MFKKNLYFKKRARTESYREATATTEINLPIETAKDKAKEDSVNKVIIKTPNDGNKEKAKKTKFSSRIFFYKQGYKIIANANLFI